ncbi:IS3 family transposase [Acaricomes phytoseiuli]|nr:IS3 family transposase [Acaricomes phytoseiuli]MCW1248599.1 IS3 family transposase [Acaricomes phytoseiuli]
MHGFLTSRGYRAAKIRPVSLRALSDEFLGAEIVRLHAENYSVYGVRKMHVLMSRAGWRIGRDQVGRLMSRNRLHGVRRAKKVFTTIIDPVSARPADLVNRQFSAKAPNRLWVSDITYISTWSGFAYTAFVTDVFTRKIVGWTVSATMATEKLPLQALEMASWASPGNLAGLIHHSDRGSQYVSIRYTDRLAELGVQPSVGSRGDSYDNALAEAVNAVYKTELIKARKPWRTVEEVELATLEWVWWYNNQRLHSALGYQSPQEFETAHYAGLEPTRTPTGALAKT